MTNTNKKTPHELHLAELFEIYLDKKEYYLTNAPADIEFNGKKYIARQITHDKVVIEPLKFSDKFVVSLPSNTPEAKQWRNDFALAKNTIVIKILNVATNEARTLWSGVILNKKNDFKYFKLECANKLQELNSQLLRRRYSYFCPKMIYSHDCRAKRIIIAGKVTGSGDGAIEIDKDIKKEFLGGVIRIFTSNNQFYNIISNISGQTLTLEEIFFEDFTGYDFEIYRPCDKTIETCRNVFNNEENYGGFLGIPRQNCFTKNVFF